MENHAVAATSGVGLRSHDANRYGGERGAPALPSPLITVVRAQRASRRVRISNYWQSPVLANV